MQMILNTKGLIVSQRNQCFQIKHGETTRLISPSKITSIAVTSNCLLSTSAIILAAQHQIPIYFVDNIGQVHATSRSANFESISTIRRKQSFFAVSSNAVSWVCGIFKEKNIQSQENLRWLSKQAQANTESIETALRLSAQFETYLEELATKRLSIKDCRSQLLGKEGSVAKSYWEAIAKNLPIELDFENRTRRPSTDPFNAALNYLYGMLYTDVEQALWAAGLDPYLGIFHVDEYKSPTLSFDLIEPFRPWADRFLLEACKQRIFSEIFIEIKEGNGHFVNIRGKAWLIPAWNSYLQIKEQMGKLHVSRKNTIHRMADELRLQIERFEHY